MICNILTGVNGSPTTEKPPCKGDCEVAYAENLVGCDPRSGNCICEEGYMLKDEICVGKNPISS